jgi:hypothetical protein
MDAPVPYGRMDPTSPVRAYQAGPGFIWVVFEHRGKRTAYRYTAESAGVEAVAWMQTLAARGHGLATYIAKHFSHMTGHDRRIVF